MAKVKALTPRQQDRRHRILAAARDMVAQRGYDGMIMSEVAAQAGVSATTLYNLYNTKDELVMTALQESITERALQVAAESDGPGWDYLVRSMVANAQTANDEPAYAEAIMHALLRASPGDALVEMLFDNVRKDMLRSIRAMAEKKELLPNVNTEELALAMTGVYWSSFMLWNKGLLKLPMLERQLQRNCLSLLIPASTGKVKKELEARYEAIE